MARGDSHTSKVIKPFSFVRSGGSTRYEVRLGLGQGIGCGEYQIIEAG
jgi:hypothetical protein